LLPIIITTLTVIGGLISLAFGWGGNSLLWGPVASSIVWGLAVATPLTLFATPLMHGWLMRKRLARER
jgi:multidrug efflux pump subunit AcrB